MASFPSERTIEIIRSLGIRYIIMDMRKADARRALDDIQTLYQREFTVIRIPKADKRICVAVHKSSRNFVDLENLVKNAKLPPRVASGHSLNLRFPLDISPGKILINPLPDYNTGLRFRWSDQSGRRVLRSEVRTTSSFFLNSTDKFLTFYVSVPTIPGKYSLEITPMFDDETLRIHEIQVL
jgi:hypothetical protein